MTEALEKPDPAAGEQLPGEALDGHKMPGHWVLARLGKRVLRPGGLELTRQLLAALKIDESDHVIEFAPGLGITAKMTLAVGPASYTAIERDPAAANLVTRYLQGPTQRCVCGTAEHTGLDAEVATVVYGEAMLTMQTLEQKRSIVREAFRLLRPGGRYAIHEICLVPDDIAETEVQQLEKGLSQVIRVGARPLRNTEWRTLLEAAGFKVEDQATSGFHLLEPRRMIQDEGLFRTLRFAFNMLRDKPARQRVFAMRRVFRTHAEHMAAIMLVGVKP